MDWSYIAGFLDGEGTVCISQPRISCANTEIRVLEKIQMFLGFGNISVEDRSNRKDADGYPRRDMYRLWVCGRENVLELAEKLVDRSVLKHRELRALIEKLRLTGEIDELAEGLPK